LRWFGHVQQKSEDDWVPRCTTLLVEGTKPKARPKKTWTDRVVKDIGLDTNDIADQGRYGENRLTRVCPDKTSVKVKTMMMFL